MSGTLLMRSSEWSLKFLDAWEAQYHDFYRNPNHDQAAFEHVTEDRDKEHIKVLPPSEFMTYDTSLCPSSAPPRFGIHFPNRDEYRRIKSFLADHMDNLPNDGQQHKIQTNESIAVGIPSIYDDRNLLLRCLDSVAAQTLTPNEVVVFMSGVPTAERADLELTYARRLDGIPLTFLTDETLQYANEARNSVATHVSAHWIAFVDSDDIMHPKRLEIFRRVLDSAPTDLVLALHGHNRTRLVPIDVACDVDRAVVHGDVLVAKRLGHQWNHGRKVTPNCQYDVHNGYPTVLTRTYLQYNQTWQPHHTEDQEFIERVFKGLTRSDQVVYVDLPLSVWDERTTRIGRTGRAPPY